MLVTRISRATISAAMLTLTVFSAPAYSVAFPPYVEPQLPAHPPDGECEKPFDKLIAMLKSGESSSRWIAADCLGDAKDSRAVEPLVHAIFVENYPRLTMIERQALKKIDDPHTADLLLEALNSKETRWKAALSLGDLQITRAVDPLIMFLKSDDKEDRRTAAMSLGPMQDPRAIDALISTFAERDEVLRRYAATSLGKIGDAPAVNALIKALDDPDEGVEWNAIASLGETKDLRAVLPLAKILHDSDEQDHSRTEAADALAKFGDATSIDALIEAGASNNNAVRWHVGRALASAKNPHATQFLTESLNQGKIAVVGGAYPFFIRRGDPASEPALVEALQEFDDYVMANDFLFCGNTLLAKAAHTWFSKRGYQ